MERLAILDHASHCLYVEDVSEEALAPYEGDEERYIEDNYVFDGEYSWEYITDANYLPSDDNGGFVEIDFNTLK